MEQRRSVRYQMRLPLHIVQVGSEKLNLTVQTRDISTGGVSFLSSSAVEVGGRIEYLITLSGANPPVKIRCLGKVLRSQNRGTGETPFEIAVTMERYQFMNPSDADSFPFPN